MRRFRGQSGFGLIESLLIILILGVAVFGVYMVWHNNNQMKKSSLSQTANQNSQPPTINNYYDCWDKKGATDGSSTDCTINNTTYKLPTAYTADMIRGYSKVPDDALPLITQIAQQTFKDCSVAFQRPLPSEVKIYDAVDSKYIYLGVACDSGHRELLYKDASEKWQEIDLGQMGLSCEVANKYKVPAALLVNAGDDEKAVCYNNDGSTTALTN